MTDINEIIRKLIKRIEFKDTPITLLAVCPNSSAVLEAAVKAATQKRSVMLFAATLNQVDIDGSYTGWTPADFVLQMNAFATKYDCSGPLFPCLDHGGPWLKDQHTIANLSYTDTMTRVKESISACIRAGYKLLHIDPTVDRTLPDGESLPVQVVVERTVELIAHAENIRKNHQLPRIAYEVGTEEVHGGLVDLTHFKEFLQLIKIQLDNRNLGECWPCLLVAQIGTNLHTTVFNPQAARNLLSILAPLGSMVKGHYTDWVENPEEYPITGMGGANVGPEFSAEEYHALVELEKLEQKIIHRTPLEPSHFIETLQHAVFASNRWKKWLLPDEIRTDFWNLPAGRREWLIKTGSRYIWTDESVIAARNRLYQCLSNHGVDPHAFVIEKISNRVEKYIDAFNLQNSIDILY